MFRLYFTMNIWILIKRCAQCCRLVARCSSHVKSPIMFLSQEIHIEFYKMVNKRMKTKMNFWIHNEQVEIFIQTSSKLLFLMKSKRQKICYYLWSAFVETVDNMTDGTLEFSDPYSEFLLSWSIIDQEVFVFLLFISLFVHTLHWNVFSTNSTICKTHSPQTNNLGYASTDTPFKTHILKLLETE